MLIPTSYYNYFHSNLFLQLYSQSDPIISFATGHSILYLIDDLKSKWNRVIMKLYNYIYCKDRNT